MAALLFVLSGSSGILYIAHLNSETEIVEDLYYGVPFVSKFTIGRHLEKSGDYESGYIVDICINHSVTVLLEFDMNHRH